MDENNNQENSSQPNQEESKKEKPVGEVRQGKSGGNNPPKPKSGNDPFILSTLFPEAEAIFSGWLKPLLDIKDDCVVVLDSTVLIDPYNYKTLDFIEEFLDTFRKILVPLIEAKRLVIPGQVAREYAKNRGWILTELYKNLLDIKIPEPYQALRSSLLSSLDEAKEVNKFASEINQKREEYNKAIKKVRERVGEWVWNDPVSLLFNDLFSKDVVLDILTENKKLTIKDDFERRLLNEIPPVAKSGDREKDDGGIGDLIIW